VTVKLERFTIALLIRRSDAPELSNEEASASQDAHLSHLADLHEAGQLIAAGPLGHPELRGLIVLAGPPQEVEKLLAEDPAVQIGRFSVKTMEWMVPAGAIRLSPTRFPRSAAEVED
jgi:uncharacterized protein YciI